MASVELTEQQRRAYLDAMGIQQWELRSRQTGDDAEPVVAEVVTPETVEVSVSTPVSAPASEPVATQATEKVTPELIPELIPELTPKLIPKLTLDWAALEQTVKACQDCELHKDRTQAVFGVGDQNADWLIIGEAPGADEDRLGEPFVGRAGQLLNAMLKAVGLQREQVYIANIVKCRPPENRNPRPEEAASCNAYLQRQVELIRPKLILAVGAIAAHNLLATDIAVGKLRGQVHYFGEQKIPLVVTYHPAYLLRSPSQKAKAWDDLQLARKVVQGVQR